jgi:hypothetical protein
LGDHINEEEMGTACGERGARKGFWLENRNERDVGIDGRIILNWLWKQNGRVWSGFI